MEACAVLFTACWVQYRVVGVYRPSSTSLTEINDIFFHDLNVRELTNIILI